ncbi:hypothetical protein [Fructobacillus cardui]|uniref:hypothetical protein n=1 Tax=Fructobacillus cardui TaxID=2893170 RepID=UPI002DA3C6ED|nr:hypothetical protein R53653_IHELHDKM_00894 [Fructobacillus cardui]
MVNFLLPITFFSKTYSYSLAEPMAMISMPVFIIIILIQLFRFPQRLKYIIPSLSAIVLGITFWLLQLVAMFLSYNVTGESKITAGIIHSSIILGGWNLAIYVAWAVIQVTVMNEKDEKRFIKSGLVGLSLYLLLIVFPQFLVSFHFRDLVSYVNGVANVFEERWRTVGGYSMYANGSYVTTQGRVNGLEPESSYLANLLGIVYLPILIGLTVAKKNVWNWISSQKKSVWFNSLLALIVLLVLVLARTTTGILTAFVVYILWIIWSKGKFRASLLITAISALILLVAAYMSVPAVHTIFNQFIFAKQGTDNRLGGTIALAITFLQHPILGVGSGFTSYFIIQNVPIATTQNFEFQHLYSQYGFPILSDFLGWLATYGLVIMIPAFYLLFRLISRDFLSQYRLKNRDDLNIDKSWSRGLHVSFITMIILIAFSSIFIIKIYLWPYLLMFFFYRKHIMRLEEELKQ